MQLLLFQVMEESVCLHVRQSPKYMCKIGNVLCAKHNHYLWLYCTACSYQAKPKHIAATWNKSLKFSSTNITSNSTYRWQCHGSIIKQSISSYKNWNIRNHLAGKLELYNHRMLTCNKRQPQVQQQITPSQKNCFTNTNRWHQDNIVILHT